MAKTTYTVTEKFHYGNGSVNESVSIHKSINEVADHITWIEKMFKGFIVSFARSGNDVTIDVYVNW